MLYDLVLSKVRQLNLDPLVYSKAVVFNIDNVGKYWAETPKEFSFSDDSFPN